MWWLEIDRPATGAATVFVHSGEYVRHDGKTVLVVQGGKMRFVQLMVWFENKEEAECSAIGWTVRLVRNFRFPAAVAKWSDTGVLIHTVLDANTKLGAK